MQYAQAGSVDRARRRDRPSAAVAHNDNYAGGGRCPLCHARSWLKSGASEYHGAGVMHHHWHCEGCGHQWVTVVHVSV
jgi:hypothetical protein